MIRHTRRLGYGLRVLGLTTLLVAMLSFPLPAQAADFAAAPFRALWNQTDQDGSVPPVWGPQPLTDEVDEAYAEAPGGYRAVQYFDKGRMELSNPANGSVSAGLLATELITAKIQTGDGASKAVKPAIVPVAGDPDNIFPTYASLVDLMPSPPAGSATGPVTRVFNPNGTFGVRQEAASDPAAAYAATDGLTGHTVPRAFVDFRNDPRHPLTTIGLAITEPFWAKVKVGGAPKDVMMQAFERRVLTYTPSNVDPYKVEFGNIGQHYYRWRYSLDGGAETAIPAGVLPNFRAAYGSQFNPRLGKPVSASPTTVTYSIVIMERGVMLFVQPTQKIYALPSDTSGAVFSDTYNQQQDDCTKAGPTPGTFEPCRGFGKVWRENPAVKQALGYATAQERGIVGQTQQFENGFIFYDKERDRYWMANTAQFFARYFPV